MRTRHVCPKCDHNRILLIDEVPERGDSNILRPLNIAKVVMGKTFMGDDKHGTAGAMSAAVCRSCGYTELFVYEPAALPIDGRLIREVTGPAK